MEGTHKGGRKEGAENQDDDDATRWRHDFVSLWRLRLMVSARFVVPVLSCEVVVRLSCVRGRVQSQRRRNALVAARPSTIITCLTETSIPSQGLPQLARHLGYEVDLPPVAMSVVVSLSRTFKRGRIKSGGGGARQMTVPPCSAFREGHSLRNFPRLHH